MTQSFVYDKYINKTWLITVLPYLLNNGAFAPALGLNTIDKRFDPKIVDGQILVNLKPITDKEINTIDYHILLQNNMMDLLYDLYQKGTVVANVLVDQPLITQHRLTPLFNLAQETQLYQFSGTLSNNDNPTEYLLQLQNKK